MDWSLGDGVVGLRWVGEGVQAWSFRGLVFRVCALVDGQLEGLQQKELRK